MCFTYIFRDKTGVKREATIEAASREDAFATLRAKGIAPIKLSETGRDSARSLHGRAASLPVQDDDKNRRPVRSTNGHARNSSLPVIRVIFILVVLVAASALVWRWVTTDEQTSRPDQQPQKTKRVVVDTPKRPLPENGNPVQTGKVESNKASINRPAKTKRTPDGQPSRLGKIVSVVTNEAGFILTTIEEDGKQKIITETLTPPTFKNPMHQLIAAIVTTDNGSEMAPLPLGPGDDAAMRAALKLPIKDLPTDTEEIKKLKDAVRATRKDIESLMDQGISVSEIFTQHRELWNDNIKIRNEMIGEYRRFLSEGDLESAGKYLEQINRSFREMGIPEIEEADIQPKGKKKRRNTQ